MTECIFVTGTQFVLKKFSPEYSLSPRSTVYVLRVQFTSQEYSFMSQEYSLCHQSTVYVFIVQFKYHEYSLCP